MIVVDASAVVVGLLNSGQARRALADEPVAPHLIDSEVVHAIRGLTLRKKISEKDARRTLDTWSKLSVGRFPLAGLIPRIWELRHNLSAYDAGYVALAEALDVDLLTADSAMTTVSGKRCRVIVVSD